MNEDGKMIARRKTHAIKVGNVTIGGSALISVQSMTKTDTRDVKATVEQIHDLEEAGCEIIRVAVPDMAAAEAVKEIKKEVNIPLVADIHFDYRLALKCAENGVDKLRINPGNIGSEDKVKLVVNAAKDYVIPIRIGINAGSLHKYFYSKFGGITPEALVESAMEHVRILEKLDFYDTLISVKDSNVTRMIEAYKLLAKRVNYPLHLGVTHAGTPFAGTVANSIGIGALLSEGIGDTIRVSLAGDPREEVKAGFEILKSLELRERGPHYIVCPTCGRTEINLIKLANEVEDATANIKEPIHIAIMGCTVNGPGEAREADVGVAGGKGIGAIFRKGKVVRTVPEKEILPALLEEINKLLVEREAG